MSSVSKCGVGAAKSHQMSARCHGCGGSFFEAGAGSSAKAAVNAPMETARNTTEIFIRLGRSFRVNILPFTICARRNVFCASDFVQADNVPLLDDGRVLLRNIDGHFPPVQIR